MNAQNRRMQVLSAIVQDYVASSEPVGSKAIVERHNMSVSPATVRNDMAYLEEAGYITQPHTSAGRIPTDLGYRTFVDRIEDVKPLSPAERRAIESFLAGAVDLDDVLERTVRLLSHVTHQAAVIQYPSLRRATLQHLEVVPLSTTRALVVVITNTGRVEQRLVELPEDTDLEALHPLLNSALVGRALTEMEEMVEAITAGLDPDQRSAVEAITEPVYSSLGMEHEERIVMAGASNLVRSPGDFRGTLAPVLEALEEQVVMLRLLQELATHNSVAVSIGSENQHEPLSETSLVTTSYGSASIPAGVLAVVGPTRMDYPSAMASVRAVAAYVSDFLQRRQTGTV